jgi:hypothetical protein
MPKRNRGKKKKKKSASSKPEKTADEAMLCLSPALQREEAMLDVSPASSEEALLDPNLSPDEQCEDNLLDETIPGLLEETTGISGAALLRSQDKTAANVVGNWSLDEDASLGRERQEGGTQHNPLPTILVGTRTIMSAASEVSTPMLVLGISEPMTRTQKATNTFLAIARDEEGGPNDPNYDVDYNEESDAGKGESTPPRASEQCLRLRNALPVAQASKVLKQTDVMRLVANKDIRLRTSTLNHNPQQRVEIMNEDGIYEYSNEELAGYLSPGESTYRIQAGLLVKQYRVYRVRANRHTVRYTIEGKAPHSGSGQIQSIFDKLNLTEYNGSHLYHGYTVRYNLGDNVLYPVR